MKTLPFLTPSLLAAIAVLLLMILKRMPVMPATTGELAAAHKMGEQAIQDIEARQMLVKVRDTANVFVANGEKERIPVDASYSELTAIIGNDSINVNLRGEPIDVNITSTEKALPVEVKNR